MQRPFTDAHYRGRQRDEPRRPGTPRNRFDALLRSLDRETE